MLNVPPLITAIMHLVQILLPLYDNDGARFRRDLFLQVHNELVERFGGLTAYTQAPASGVWQESDEHVVHDDLVVYEVMADELDAAWWRDYRASLEKRFRQDQLIVRTHEIQIL